MDCHSTVRMAAAYTETSPPHTHTFSHIIWMVTASQMPAVLYTWPLAGTNSCSSICMATGPYGWLQYCTDCCKPVQTDTTSFDGCRILLIATAHYEWLLANTDGCSSVWMAADPYGLLQPLVRLGTAPYGQPQHCSDGCSPVGTAADMYRQPEVNSHIRSSIRTAAS